MDIATLVKAVISGFDDATSLVKRIKSRQEESEGNPLPEEPLRDLLDSLALGPVIVRGHFDHDLKRFGEPYACGDIQAREQMKDVLINLQMALMTHLRTVWMDDMELDFDALQSASDDCRVNAGVCLGQLSQRLSDAAKAQAMYPHNMMPYSTGGMLMPPMSPSLHYSSSRSTTSSSTFSRAVPPRTPDSAADQFASMSMSASTIRPGYSERKPSGSSTGSQNGYGRYSPPQRNDYPPPMPSIGQYMGQPVALQPRSEEDAHSMRRPSSHTLAPEDSVLLSPSTYSPESGTPQQSAPPQQLPGAEDLDRASYVSIGRDSQNQPSPHLSRTSSNHQSLAGASDRDRTEDRVALPVRTDSNAHQYGTIYDMQPQMLEGRPVATSYSARTQAAANTRDYSTLEHVTYLQQNARPPVSDMMRNQPPPQRQYQQPMQNQMYGQQTMQGQMYQPPSMQNQPQMQSQLYSQPSIQSMQSMQSMQSLNQSQMQNQNQNQLPYSQPNSQPPYRQATFPTTSAGRSIPGPGTPPLCTNSFENPQTPRADYSRPSFSSQVSVQPNHAPPVPSTNGHAQNHVVPPPMPPPMHSQVLNRTASVTTNNSNSTTNNNASAIALGPLILATDKNTQGFCKGAQRLQAGLDKKAFSTAARPAGFSGMIQFWKCEKCSFEGPLVMSVLPGAKKNKPDKTFDHKIRVAQGGGIRYRWAFLAKSHILCKTMIPDGPRDGSFGTFGCVFCCAEGGPRGWHDGNAKAEMIKGTGGTPGTPIFGNVQSFMEHLQMHRSREGWPCQDMLTRMKAVVGRVAEVGEDWEVNFCPL